MLYVHVIPLFIQQAIAPRLKSDCDPIEFSFVLCLFLLLRLTSLDIPSLPFTSTIN